MTLHGTEHTQKATVEKREICSSHTESLAERKRGQDAPLSNALVAPGTREHPRPPPQGTTEPRSAHSPRAEGLTHVTGHTHCTDTASPQRARQGTLTPHPASRNSERLAPSDPLSTGGTRLQGRQTDRCTEYSNALFRNTTQHVKTSFEERDNAHKSCRGQMQCS